jgi:hypothetical protein
MPSTPIKYTSHFSIIWAVSLSILTLMEWRNLDRNPMQDQILLPYIEREIQLQAGGQTTPLEQPSQAEKKPLQYEVKIGFNGPLFLAYFFGPILLFEGLSRLFGALRRRK